MRPPPRVVKPKSREFPTPLTHKGERSAPQSERVQPWRDANPHDVFIAASAILTKRCAEWLDAEAEFVRHLSTDPRSRPGGIKGWTAETDDLAVIVDKARNSLEASIAQTAEIGREASAYLEARRRVKARS